MKEDSELYKFNEPYGSRRVPQPFALSCDQVIKLLKRYERWDMSLATDTCHHIKDHLGFCPSCTSEYAYIVHSMHPERE